MVIDLIKLKRGFIHLLFFLLLPTSTFAQKLTLVSIDYPPFSGQSLKNYGPLVDITTQVFSQAGYQSSVIFMPWARAINWCQQAKIDGIIGIWQTKERQEFGYFSAPLVANQMIFYQNVDQNIQFESFAQLAAQKIVIGTVRGYALADGLEKSGVELYQVADDEQNFRMLAKGRVDLITVDKEFARYLLSQPPFSVIREQVKPLAHVLRVEPQHVLMCGKTDGARIRAEHFNEQLAIFRNSGRFEQVTLDHGLED